MLKEKRIVGTRGSTLALWQTQHVVERLASVTPGLDIWWAPGNSVMLTAGYAYNQYKSRAHLCPPIFDG